MTAVERLVMAGTNSEITETVATRVADLTLIDDTVESWEKRRTEVKAAYALRSDLVHGSVSPFSERVMRGVSQVGEVAEDAIAQCLLRLGASGLQAPDISEADYAGWFERAREYVQRLHSSASNP